MLRAHSVIVLAKRRGLVDNAGTTVCCDVGVLHDDEGGVRHGGEVREKWNISLADKVCAGELLEFLVAFLLVALCFRSTFVELRETSFRQHVDLASRVVLDFHVLHLGVHAQCEITWQRPRGCGPRKQVDLWIVHEREADRGGGVCDIAVVQTRLKVGERGVARSGVRHDLVRAVHQLLLEDSFENPPNGLHKPRLHGLVVVLEVDPAPQSVDYSLPLAGVACHDAAAFFVVGGDAHFHHIVAGLDAELLINFVLNGEPVAVPSEAARHVVPGLVRISGDGVLDGPGQNVAVMRPAGGKRRSVVERVQRPALAEFQRRLECVD
mmetsp:Transcript_25713/g.37932  ORF Transcript_25713/g.37932 Transcript_25713/m.37932 type:complete len:323 (-) Transcript_25713:161-1129(-)